MIGLRITNGRAANATSNIQYEVEREHRSEYGNEIEL